MNTKKEAYPWHQGTMKEDILDLKEGATVVFKKSRDTLDVGITWWVLGPSKVEHAFVLYRVSEQYGGKNLRELVQAKYDKATMRVLRAPPKVAKRYNRLARNVARNFHKPSKAAKRVRVNPIRSAPL